MAFAFEDLKVYRDSLAFVERVHHLLEESGRHYPKAVKDQMARAALSVPLNIAEGSGRWHEAEKKQFFWIARGSVFECVALTQVMARMKLLDEESASEYYDDLSELAKMLSGLIRSMDILRDKPTSSA